MQSPVIVESPGGRAPFVICHEYEPAPPDALMIVEYWAPTATEGSKRVVIASGDGVLVTVNCALLLVPLALVTDTE